MEQVYYLIEVYEDIDRGKSDFRFAGYYTSIYTVNKGKYCGYSSDPNYKEVTKFKSEKTAQNHIDKVLNKAEFGGEAVSVAYKFNVVSMKVDINDRNDKQVITQESRKIASEILSKIFNEKNIVEEYNTFCLDNNIDDEQAENIWLAINNLYLRIKKIL